MGEWTPVLAGFGYIAVVVIAMRAFPNSWWVGELTRRRGVQPSGPNATLTRRDHFRTAGRALLAAIVLLGASIPIMNLADNYPNGSLASNIAFAYGMMCFLLFDVAMLVALIAVCRAVFWRQPRESEDLQK